MQFNEDSIWTYEFRRGELPQRLLKLEDMIRGRSLSFLPLITGADGMISDRKLTRLISQILDAFSAFHKAFPGSRDPRSQARRQLELYRHFLYGAMLCLKTKSNLLTNVIDSYEDMCYFEAWEFNETFSDLVVMVNAPSSVIRGDLEALYQTESQSYADGLQRLRAGFFGCMDDTGKLLFKDVYHHLVPEKFLQEAVQAQRAQSFDEDDRMAQRAGYSSYQEYIDAWNEKLSGYEEQTPPESEPPDDAAWAAYEKSIRRRGSVNRRQFLSRLPDRERWLQHYLKYRALYFSDEIKRELIAEDIRDAIDAYLYIHDHSLFARGDSYGLITNRLNRIESELRNEILRVRRFS